MPYTTRSQRTAVSTTKPKPPTKVSKKKSQPSKRLNTTHNPSDSSAHSCTNSPCQTDSPTNWDSPDPSFNTIPGTEDNPQTSQCCPKKAPVFQSRFPGSELDTFKNKLENWSLIKLQDAIRHQDSRRSNVPRDIKDLVKIVRMEFEKRILMIALMAAVPEVVIWNMVGIGSKAVKVNLYIHFLTFCVRVLGNRLPDRDDKQAWATQNQDKSDIGNALSKDQQNVFKDPYFFALANIPDYPNTTLANTQDDENGSMMDLNSNASAPKVHQLSDEDKLTYQPISNDLVNVEKVHLCHGKPDQLPSVATLQKRSLVAVRKAHQEFSVVCQQNQISYYLTTASCGNVDGWSQTFSNNVKFANWALKTHSIPSKFTNYVHGKEVARQIEGKQPQPSDLRKSQLCHQLNKLLDVHLPGKSFPKQEDPVGYIQRKNWPVQIVQRSGSLLEEENLFTGHQRATDAVVCAWLNDIENGLFLLESKEELGTNKVHSKKKQRKNLEPQEIQDTTQERPRQDENHNMPLSQS
ncbi:hypothetical protein DFH28DRAFT_1069466 [Melampsora americana]|nr:hypothetical protein DFH28DRAFT_1069466 [Melampsora americana]